MPVDPNEVAAATSLQKCVLKLLVLALPAFEVSLELFRFRCRLAQHYDTRQLTLDAPPLSQHVFSLVLRFSLSRALKSSITGFSHFLLC